ncbi:MAG: recombinase family protein [Dehalococcoidales bacterium]|nr:recombinase family protein [Dehalococcoidales bacterium]
MTLAMPARIRKIANFEDLKGLRAAAYIRDSTLDQRDGFGPDIQRHNEERFALNTGLILANRWYTEFVSGRSVKKRYQFQQFLEDARMDLFDVLLVDHTSRFGRNQAECIRYKEELQRLGKTVVFVSQGIISGSDRDFLSERINETLDEQYSRNLSRYVLAGMYEKAKHGLANGPAPFGYKSELVGEGRRERKVQDPKYMPALLQLLRDYATGNYSFTETAERLNAVGYRNQNDRLFTEYFIRDVLSNRFYEGKVVYHKGQPDELVIDGKHEVPEEVRTLWLQCQQVKKEHLAPGAGHPRGPARIFPFSKVLKCHFCEQPYYGEAAIRNGSCELRLSHERRAAGRNCKVKPQSCSVDFMVDELGGRVLPYLQLPVSWKPDIINALQSGKEKKSEDVAQRPRLERAIENIRKQHLWGDLTDAQYKRDRQDLEGQLKSLTQSDLPIQMPNLERAAHLLETLPVLWKHPGTTDQQREEIVKHVFNSITIGGKQIMSVDPKDQYRPFFATIIAHQNVGYPETGPPPSPP